MNTTRFFLQVPTVFFRRVLEEIIYLAKVIQFVLIRSGRRPGVRMHLDCFRFILNIWSLSDDPLNFF